MRLQDSLNFSQARDSIRPDLHGVDRERFIESAILERKFLHGAAPQVDTAFLFLPSRSGLSLARPFLSTGQRPQCMPLM